MTYEEQLAEMRGEIEQIKYWIRMTYEEQLAEMRGEIKQIKCWMMTIEEWVFELREREKKKNAENP